MIRGYVCRLLAEIAVGFLIRTLKEFSDGRNFTEKPGFSLELSLVVRQIIMTQYYGYFYSETPVACRNPPTKNRFYAETQVSPGYPRRDLPNLDHWIFYMAAERFRVRIASNQQSTRCCLHSAGSLRVPASTL
jgi:hypothetical protein